MTRLSIAMTTFNGAAYLPEQLRSFASQERLPDQLVACDDGSSDATVDILDRFAKEAPFAVKVVRNAANLGHELNFGQAIDLADGDIILLADQDDRWDPDKLDVVEREFAANPATVLMVNDVRITDGDLKPTGRTLLGQLRSSGLIGLDNRGLLIGCGTSFRSSLKPLLLPVPPLDYGHDTWVNEFAALLGAKRIIERPLQDYRRHPSNASFTGLDGTERATAATIMWPSRGKDLSPEWSKRVAALDEMKRRLTAFGDERYAELGLARPFNQALAEIEGARQAVTNRMEMFRVGAFGRKMLAMKLLAQGDYRHFSGLRSFAKDLVR